MNLFTLFVSLMLASWGVSCLTGDGSAEVEPARISPSVVTFLKNHCVDCHGPQEQNGSMRFDTIPTAVSDATIALRWQDILDVVNLDQMPPEDAPQPAKEDLSNFLETLTLDLGRAGKALTDSGGHIVLRRMNRLEYQQTIQSLLGVPVEVHLLPEDATVNGFDTLGQAHGFSSLQLERYLARPETQNGVLIPFHGVNPSAFVQFGNSTQHGLYRIRVRCGVAGERPVDDLYLKVVRGEFRSTVPDAVDFYHVTGTVANPQTIEFVVELDDQIRSDRFSFQRRHARWQKLDQFAEARNYYFKFPQVQYLLDDAQPNLWIDWIEMDGPLPQPVPPLSRAALLASEDPATIDGEQARAIIERFAHEAFRHQAPDAEYVDRPQRLIFLSYSWGVAEDHWFPKQAGPDYEISECLKPLARHKADFSVLSNLTNKRATNGHWGCTTWLTSANVNGTPGKQFQNTISVDQLAARKLGVATRFNSLESSCSADGGGFGPGLSLSWSETGNPIAGETSPVALFDRLFGAAEVPLAQRKYLLHKEQSVLDAVMIDARSMHSQLSKVDRDKVDEYFQSVRDIELRLAKSEEWLDRPKPEAPFDRPSSTLKTTAGIQVMYDLMVAAIQTDMTRVITYRQPVEGIFADLGYKVTGHKTTHCTKDSDAYQASIARDQKQLDLLANLWNSVLNHVGVETERFADSEGRLRGLFG